MVGIMGSDHGVLAVQERGDFLLAARWREYAYGEYSRIS